jgi:hypothetical protein
MMSEPFPLAALEARAKATLGPAKGWMNLLIEEVKRLRIEVAYERGERDRLEQELAGARQTWKLALDQSGESVDQLTNTLARVWMLAYLWGENLDNNSGTMTPAQRKAHDNDWQELLMALQNAGAESIEDFRDAIRRGRS